MKPLHRRLILAAALAAFLPAFGQPKQNNVLDLKYSIQDSEIVYPESFETGSQKLLERWYLKNYTSTDPNKVTDYDPGATEEEIRERLAALPTVIDMPYNDIVRQYIERFTKRGRKQVSALLGLSSYYMPIFEQELEEAGLPLELKYLPVIESGLDPTATSKHGAAGLWQFILASARGYDMEVNSLVDERRDPYISSEKACAMLRDLYDTYGDWSLAIAAYNCGPGTVNKALNRAGGTPQTHDFWSIYFYLPEETRGYVPMFIAANYVMNYYPEHGISPVLATKPLITDSVHIVDRIHFNQIAAVLDIPVEELRVLNPQFRADIIPGSADHPYNLILPSQQMHAFLVSQDQIYAYERDKYARKLEAVPGAEPEGGAVELVAEGEPLNPADPVPAEEAAAQLAYEEIHPEEAAVPSRRRNDPEPAPAAQTAPAKTETKPAPAPKKSETNAKQSTAQAGKADSSSQKNQKKDSGTAKQKSTVHTVTSGQNLSVIAKKYGVTVDQLKKANPNVKTDMIRPGDKLTIPSKTTPASSKSGTKKRKKR